MEPAAFHVVKVAPNIMAAWKGRATIKLALQESFPVGTRVLFVEWAGQQTGRADLCHVLQKDEATTLARSWCWHSDKIDCDLSFLSLTALPAEHPMITDVSLLDV